MVLDRPATPVRLLDRLAPRGTAPQMPGQTAGGQLPAATTTVAPRPYSTSHRFFPGVARGTMPATGTRRKLRA